MMKKQGQPKRVAILGTAPSWRDAPFADDDWEIWVCNRAGLSQTAQGHKWDVLFEIHRNFDYESPQAKDRYLSEIEKIKRPQRVISVVPLAGDAVEVIDRQAMINRYGGGIWFSSTFSYMIAYAIDLEVEEIALFGVDMESREEYVTQFAGVRHLLHIAEERGVVVTHPERSLMLRDPDPYPDRFETSLAYKLEAMASDLDKKQRRAFHRMMREHAYAHQHVMDDDLSGQEQAQNVQDYEDARDHWHRIKGALWCAQHIRRLFVFNVLDPEPGDELAVDSDDSGPT